MRGLLLEPEKQAISDYVFTDHKDIQMAVNSNMFDVIYRHIGTPYSPLFTIYLDDLGVYRTPYYVSGFNADDSSRLIGNLLISRTDTRGNDISLTSKDIELIKQYACIMYNYDRGIETLGLFPIYYPRKRH